MVLHRRVRRQTVFDGGGVRRGEFGGREVRAADLADLALVAQFGQTPSVSSGGVSGSGRWSWKWST